MAGADGGFIVLAIMLVLWLPDVSMHRPNWFAAAATWPKMIISQRKVNYY
jgi:hypothetical protein